MFYETKVRRDPHQRLLTTHKSKLGWQMRFQQIALSKVWKSTDDIGAEVPLKGAFLERNSWK